MKTNIIKALCNQMIAGLILSLIFLILFTDVVYCGEFRDYRLPSQQYRQYEPERPVKVPRPKPSESRNIYIEFEEKFRHLSPEQREELIHIFNEKTMEAKEQKDFNKAEYYRTLINILEQGR